MLNFYDDNDNETVTDDFDYQNLQNIDEENQNIIVNRKNIQYEFILMFKHVLLIIYSSVLMFVFSYQNIGNVYVNIYCFLFAMHYILILPSACHLNCIKLADTILNIFNICLCIYGYFVIFYCMHILKHHLALLIIIQFFQYYMTFETLYRLFNIIMYALFGYKFELRFYKINL